MKTTVGFTSSPNVVIGGPAAETPWIEIYAYLPLNACGNDAVGEFLPGNHELP